MNEEAFEQWRQARRHELRVLYLRDFEGRVVPAGDYERWLREQYAIEHPTVDPKDAP